MKISIKNLGPIKEANIEVGNLTVFVGPNGTGKSYLARTIYGLYSYEELISFLVNNEQREHYQRLLFGSTKVSYQSLIEAIKKLKHKDTVNALHLIYTQWANYFAADLPTFFNEKPELLKNVSIKAQIKSKLTSSLLESVKEDTIDRLSKIIVSEQINKNSKSESNKLNIIIATFMARLISFHLSGKSYSDATYLPAARSNYLLTYKAILKSRSQSKGLLGSINKDERNNDRFDKPVESFLDKLSEARPNDRHLFEHANAMEKALFQDGSLKIDKSESDLANFEYILNDTGKSIKWHNTSSMVSELSPLLVIIRNMYYFNSLLVIDEPESHLHPSAQKILIDHLAILINNGLKIILITHSPYILSCVNNLIKWGGLVKNFPDNKNIKKLYKLQDPKTGLEFSECKAYKFNKGKIKSLQNNKAKLFDESEFTEPFDDINHLYESMRDIEWENREKADQ